MKRRIKSNKFKVIAVMVLAAIIAIPGILSAKPVDTKANEIDGEPMFEVEAIHTITRNDGGGAYGTHAKPSYQENGVQYFRNGDIVEVNILLPKGHGSISFQDTVKYDSTKVTLLSGYNDIRSTLSNNYLEKTWTISVNALNGDPSQILVFGSTADYTTGILDWQGGSVARMYFRVNDVETEEGTPITFEFPRFQTAGYSNGRLLYTHKGYDAANDAATAYYVAEPMTITAKKPTVAVADPTLTLKGNSATIYEGDLFDPSEYIVSASCAVDSTVSKDTVDISEGTGVYNKHQPAAGTYTYKYRVSSSTGKSTEKSVTLKVVPRTYEVSSIDTESKKIALPIGTSSDKLESMIDALKTEDFNVTITCNDGSKFTVPGKVLSGKTDKYRVDEANNLLEQSFNVNFSLALPLISYGTDGSRIVTPYNGNTGFVSNVGAGTTTANVPVVIGAGNAAGNNSGNAGGSSTGKASTAATAGGSASDGTATGDTTNVTFLAFLTILSAGVIVHSKLKKQ